MPEIKLSRFVGIRLLLAACALAPALQPYIIAQEATLPRVNPEDSDQRITQSADNPWYWQYKGKPVFLRGGSDEDNPYQWDAAQLTEHLDLLMSVGGNYIRNIMSDRDEGNIYAFEEIEPGTYDLNKWNEEYWNKVTFFLEETSKRNIIVQLTLWDHYDVGGRERWGRHPWNPKNNINMEIGSWKGRADFYATVERGADDQLAFQRKYMDKLLSVTLQFGNVLYNINNESSEGIPWENYWADFTKKAASKAGKQAYVTNMQLSAANTVRHVLSNRELFDYVDISQNNQDSKGAKGPAHWDQLMFIRQKVGGLRPLPINNVKIYGATDGSTNLSAGTETEAIERFWRNVFGGCASARFHRPSSPNKLWGSGLNSRVQTNLKALDMLLEKFDLFSSSPHNDLLYPAVPVPSVMQAYASANIGRQYAVYFPQGRFKVEFDSWVYADALSLQWLDIDSLEWSEPTIVQVQWEGSKRDWGFRGLITLETPSNRPCIALLQVVEPRPGNETQFQSTKTSR